MTVPPLARVDAPSLDPAALFRAVEEALAEHEHASQVSGHWQEWRRAAAEVVDALDLSCSGPAAPPPGGDLDEVLGVLAAWQRELIALAQARGQDPVRGDAFAEMVTSLAAMRVSAVAGMRVPFPR